MTSGLPALRATPPGSVCWTATQPSSEFGIRDPVNSGIQKVSGDVQLLRHPLEFSEKYYHENVQTNDMLLLRNSQGLHAPLRLNVEFKLANNIQRLPGLQSSNLMSDILSGRLDTIEFDDILNDPMNAEMVGQPHVLMERRVGF